MIRICLWERWHLYIETVLKYCNFFAQVNILLSWHVPNICRNSIITFRIRGKWCFRWIKILREKSPLQPVLTCLHWHIIEDMECLFQQWHHALRILCWRAKTIGKNPEVEIRSRYWKRDLFVKFYNVPHPEFCENKFHSLWLNNVNVRS